LKKKEWCGTCIPLSRVCDLHGAVDIIWQALA
jgi:hypothetical protein